MIINAFHPDPDIEWRWQELATLWFVATKQYPVEFSVFNEDMRLSNDAQDAYFLRLVHLGYLEKHEQVMGRPFYTYTKKGVDRKLLGRL